MFRSSASISYTHTDTAFITLAATNATVTPSRHQHDRQRYHQAPRRAMVVAGAATLLACCLLLLLMPPQPLHSQASANVESWLLLPHMPISLADPALSVVGDAIHIVGGFSAMGPSTAHLRFDPGQLQWTELPALPVARADATAVTVDGKLYVLGGYNFDRGGALSANHRYDIATRQCSTATAALFPASGAGSAVVDGEILLFGGFDNRTESTAVQRYNPASDSWTLGTPMPLARSEFSAVTVNDQIYIIGGNVLSITTSANITPVMKALSSTLVSVYEPRQDSWQELAPLPEGRVAYAAAVRNNQIYVIGGSDKWVNGTIQATVLVYDISNNVWTYSTPLPMGRSGLRGVAIQDNLYIFGGYGDNGYIYSTAASFGQISSKIHLPLVTR